MTALVDFGDPRLPDRFWDKVRVADSGCWEWTACKNAKGYGKWGVPGRRWVLSHRVAYAALKGEIPAGQVIDHLCRNPACANPDHLEAVTSLENMRRGKNGKPRTHCRRNHALKGSNLYVTPSGSRHCRECRRLGYPRMGVAG